MYAIAYLKSESGKPDIQISGWAGEVEAEVYSLTGGDYILDRMHKNSSELLNLDPEINLQVIEM